MTPRDRKPAASPPRSASAGRDEGVLRAPIRRRAGKTGRRRAKSRRRSRRRTLAGRFWRYAGDASFLLFALAFIASGGLIWIGRDLPSTDNLWRSDRATRTALLTDDGAPLEIMGERYGAPVRLSDLPAYVPRAILAVEDRNFYHHVGVNPFSVGRALFVNASEGEIRQGGSTLTQQLAKNLFLGAERTYKRKIEELLLSFWLERRFTKDEILTLYLNRVYFGAGAYGVDAASRRYFAKAASELSVAEAAILAGVLKAPTRYAPDRNPADAGARARIVIDQMVSAGYLTREEAAAAAAAPVRLGQSRFATAPWFIDYALQETRTLAGGLNVDLVARTTLDRALQAALEAGIASGVAAAGLAPDVEIAAVILSGDGAVRAMAGGRDYLASQFNRAAQARRQPGSAFKPFVYLAAIEAGARIEDPVEDAPIAIGSWRPENYRGQYFGEVSLAFALSRSLNAATVRVQERVGRQAVRLAAQRMGIESPLSSGAALALGVDAVTPIELAAAYAPLVNGGYRVRPHAIMAVNTSDGDKVWRRSGVYIDRAASPSSLALLDQMLGEVVARGTGRRAALDGVRAAGKTGTTQDSRDAWFVGYAGDYVAVVWLGHDDNRPMADISGGTAPAMIWREIMTRTLAVRPPRHVSPRQAPPGHAPPQEAPPPSGDQPGGGDPLADVIARTAGAG